MEGVARIAEAEKDHQVALRLCQAEVQGVLEKYGMMIGIKRIEEFVDGRMRVDYVMMYVPRPRRNGG